MHIAANDTTAAPTSGYAALTANQMRLHHLGHLQAIATWDRMTFMPAGSASARGGAQAELATLMQALRDDASLDEHFEKAGSEVLGEIEQRNLALMRRDRMLARAIPPALVHRLTTLQQMAGAVWRPARERNDWDSFAVALRSLVEAKREQAERMGQVLGIGRYDALIDEFEPGIRHNRLEVLFDDVAAWLPKLIQGATERQRERPAIQPVGLFPISAQKMLCEQVVGALGFDFNRGRLDVSAHPFTGGVPEDVRMTTRFSETTVLSSLTAAMHESGHACYQQHLPRALLGQPIAGPCSAGVHEGQALTFERQLAPTPAFAAFLSPLLSDAFGQQSAFESGNLVRLMTHVRPGPIRVEADELTYPAHVILRVEIEAALIGGTMEVDDIPAAWDSSMQRLLGIDTRGDFANGPLQDVHWSQGMFGYFPAYLLGAMIAAQCMESVRRDQPEHDDRVAKGDLGHLRAWLAERIWHHGARYSCDELVRRATGQVIGADAWHRHLEGRYGSDASASLAA